MDSIDGLKFTWLDDRVMNVGCDGVCRWRARERSLESAKELRAAAKTRAQREEAEHEVKLSIFFSGMKRRRTRRLHKFKRIDAAAKARDELPVDSEEYNAAHLSYEDVMTREIGIPGPFLDDPTPPSRWAESVLSSDAELMQSGDLCLV